MFGNDKIIITEEPSSVTELCLKNAASLEELSLYPNIESLIIEHSEVDDYNPIAELKHLKSLELDNCNVSDLSFLTELNALEDLTIFNCKITDIRPLAALKDLRKLNLAINEISDISPLAELDKLTEVDLAINPITSIAPMLGKPKLKKLEIDTLHLKDRHLLIDKSIRPALECSIDFPETFPKEWAKQQEKKNRKPRVKILADVDSRVYFCNKAVLVSVKDGMNRFINRKHEEKSASKALNELFFDEQSLVHAHFDQSPTCTNILYHGYGDGIMGLDECAKVGEKINEGFNNLHEAVENAAPLLGLFESGLYVVGDFELYPRSREQFFWDAEDNFTDVCRSYYDLDDIDRSDSPMYVFPSQRAAMMNKERVDYYVSRMDEQEHFLRAIATYLTGDMALLLDGHHKAAAAALCGKPVKCLVFFKVDELDGLKEALEHKERIYLCHGKNIRQSGFLNLIAKDNKVGEMNGYEHWKKEKLYAYPAVEEPEWGKVDDKYKETVRNYPSDYDLYYGTLIPADKIQETFARLFGSHKFNSQVKEQPWTLNLDEWEKDAFRALCAYAKLFPESKWLTEKQRRFLEEYSK